MTYKQLQNKAPKSGPDPNVFQFSASTFKIRINKRTAIPVNLHSPISYPSSCSLAWHGCLQHYLPFKYQLCLPLCGLPSSTTGRTSPFPHHCDCSPRVFLLSATNTPVYTPPHPHSPMTTQSELHVENRQSLAVLQPPTV